MRGKCVLQVCPTMQRRTIQRIFSDANVVQQRGGTAWSSFSCTRLSRERELTTVPPTSHRGNSTSIDSASDRAAARIKTMLWWGDFASPTPQFTPAGRIKKRRVLMQRAESNHVVKSFSIRSNARHCCWTLQLSAPEGRC